MVNYRRNFVPGGTYFFTATLKNRRSQLLLKHVDLLRQSFYQMKKERNLHVNAIVILPDHIHTVWTLPPGDNDYSNRWKMVKGLFTKSLKEKGFSFKHNHKGEHQLWQPRYWEHTITDEQDLENHINYIHFNPVKHGLVKEVKEWPYSSFHRYVNDGRLPNDWGGKAKDFKGLYGE